MTKLVGSIRLGHNFTSVVSVRIPWCKHWVAWALLRLLMVVPPTIPYLVHHWIAFGIITTGQARTYFWPTCHTHSSFPSASNFAAQKSYPPALLAAQSPSVRPAATTAIPLALLTEAVPTSSSSSEVPSCRGTNHIQRQPGERTRHLGYCGELKRLMYTTFCRSTHPPLVPQNTREFSQTRSAVRQITFRLPCRHKKRRREQYGTKTST